jgi:hypothetical protein
MRRHKALLLTVLTGALVVMLALGFALLQHPEAELEDVPPIRQSL